MVTKRLTVDQTVTELKQTLISYIESTYHISNRQLVEDRRKLLELPGTIAQLPYVESTPRYKEGPSYFTLGLDSAVNEIFDLLKDSVQDPNNPDGNLTRQVYDPPWHHQSEAMQSAMVDDKSLIVTTGTGSGKTETFLFPILGKLAIEAKHNSNIFKNKQAVRALVLYPMNALVNDQLGRMRLLFGDPRVVSKFREWSGRPLRFARYTSRTPYPGIRDRTKDQQRLPPLKNYYVDKEIIADDPDHNDYNETRRMIRELKSRGKWPAKPSMIEWWGKDGTSWGPTGSRCKPLAADSELLTRHEVMLEPPDILITNYSMLEYMLMRPLERPIFDATQEWLADNPDEKLLLVLDEAHLYRGSAGTEVSYLIRRLTKRLGITSERLHVICTSASFNGDGETSARFASELTGKQINDFVTINGLFRDYPAARPGTEEDSQRLSKIDIDSLYGSGDTTKREGLDSFLSYQKVDPTDNIKQDLLASLEDFGPMQLLIKSTMAEATPLDELSQSIFPESSSDEALKSLSTLMAMGSLAKLNEETPGLLPCRVHTLFRGLAGLWVCLNPTCSKADGVDRATGKLYAQPISICGCGSKVFEFFTCRHCGKAYARAYTNELLDPRYLWSEPGETINLVSGIIPNLFPLDLLLEEPTEGTQNYEKREIDLRTGQIIADGFSYETRSIWIPSDRVTADPNSLSEPGQFRNCGACGKHSWTRDRKTYSSVQDHQTKGDEPFQGLVAKQIAVQPGGNTDDESFSPLKGRKVLAFSDSRQTAARLAPNLSNYSIRDALRPLIIKGYQFLSDHNARRQATLGRIYLAAQIGALALGTRLRVNLSREETYNEEPFKELYNLLQDPDPDPEDLADCWERVSSERCPGSLVEPLLDTISDSHYSLEAFGLASVEEIKSRRTQDSLKALPNIKGVAETFEQKLDLCRAWLRQFSQTQGFTLIGSDPKPWLMRTHKGSFQAMSTYFQVKAQEDLFNQQWLPTLRSIFTEAVGDEYRLIGHTLQLSIGGNWKICQYCRTPQRQREIQLACLDCKRSDLVDLDPSTDEVFRARTAYYRTASEEIINGGELKSHLIVSKEHTAQLNQPQMKEAISLAERYELLFQDVKIDTRDKKEYAIDLLSCTTTMEVGIDIGTLSGVALRNMPPSRSNYQQRAGRAGRRADSVATVISIAGSDSHDIAHFLEPDKLIRGDIVDPSLCLYNPDIAKRHVIAFLLQQYLLYSLQDREPGPGLSPNLFSVLGTVQDFKDDGIGYLSFTKFKTWLAANLLDLQENLYTWIPKELPNNGGDLIEGIMEWVPSDIWKAIETVDMNPDPIPEPSEDDSTSAVESETPSGKVGQQYLLDRLLGQGILPRYAFPTDVSTFHIFDLAGSNQNRQAVFQYTPSQGTPIALTQYAPGRKIWVDGKEWQSGALYSPVPGELERKWEAKEIYLECNGCGFAKTTTEAVTELGSFEECPACGGDGTLGPAEYWVHPPGFVHPVGTPFNTSVNDSPSSSLATRAKLTSESQPGEEEWTHVNDRINTLYLRDQLLVTNRGITKGGRYEGFDFCPDCGRIEISGLQNSGLSGGHTKPYPVFGGETRDCSLSVGIQKHITLGTKFPTDVLLMRFNIDEPVKLLPGTLETTIALRTLSEALSKAGTLLLDQANTEIQADFRPAITPEGREGKQVEIYLYDTLDGGAGFTRELQAKGLEIFNAALDLLENKCTCDGSCYECLRSFGNRFEHGSLDRFIGSSLLRYLLYGEVNETPETLARREKLTGILYEDLKRQPDLEDFSIKFEEPYKHPSPQIPEIIAPIMVKNETNGRIMIYALHNPISPDFSSDPALMINLDVTNNQIKLFDELAVMRNLPNVTLAIVSSLRGS